MGKLRKYGSLRSLLLALFLGLPCSATLAQTLYQEDFPYVLGNIAGQGAWTAISSPGVSPVQVTPIGLDAIPWYLPILGAIQIQNVSGEDVGANVGVIATSSGSVYVGFLINVSSASTGGNVVLNFVGNGSGAANSSGFTYRLSSGQVQFGLTSSAVYASTLYPLNQTHLIVLEYNATSSTYLLYINPPQLSAKPAASTTKTHGGSAHLSISQVAVYQTLGTGAATVDGIKVSKSWSDVVGPTPGGPTSAFENFNYPGGDEIGLHGWTNFLCCNTISVGTPGLTYPRLLTSGNAAQMQTSGTSGYKLNFSPVSSGVIYVRFLVKPQISNSNNTETQLGFFSSGANSQFNERQGFNLDNNLVSIKYGGSSGSITNGPSLSDGTTGLVILGYDLASDMYQLYYNPPVGSTSPPSPTLSEFPSNLDGGSIDGVTLIQDGTLFGFFDEIVVSTNWSDLLQLDEPPQAPTGFNVTAVTSNSATFSFTNPTTVPDGFLVLRGVDSPPVTTPSDNTTYVLGQTFGDATVAAVGAATTVSDLPLIPGTKYSYIIYPYYTSGGSTNYSVSATLQGSLTTLSTEPSTHAALFTASPTTPNQVSLTFSPANSIPNAAGYIILRRQDGALPTGTGIVDGALPPSNPVAGTTTLTIINNTATSSFNDAVSPGILYTYALIPFGYNGVDVGSYNYRTSPTIPTASATTLSLEPIGPPASFSASTISSTQISINFSAANTVTNASGYVILRRQDLSNPTSTGITDGQVVLGTPVAGTTLVTTITNSATTSFTDNLTTPGIQYNYTIYPFGSNGANPLTYNYYLGVGQSASAYTFSTEPTGHAASFVATQAGTNQINLTFSQASTVAGYGYIILRRSDGTNPTSTGVSDGLTPPATPAAGTTLIADITSSSTTSFNDATVSPGNRYNYALIPYGYNGANSQTYNYRTVATVPVANAFTLSLEPANHAAVFTATAAAGQITLNFSAPSTITNAVGYILLRRSDGSDPTALGVTDGAATPSNPVVGTTLITTIVTLGQTSYSDMGVAAGTKYNYALIPFGYNGTNAQTYNYLTSPVIPTATATMLSLEPAAHPASFTATQGIFGQIDLAFSAANTITNASGYIILRRSDGTNPTATGITDAVAPPGVPVVGTILVTTITSTSQLTYSDLSVSPGTQYNYAIFPYGYNGSNDLTYNYLLTAGKTANAFSLSAEPTAHAASFTAVPFSPSQINLSFSAASTLTNAAGYIILRRQDGINPDGTNIQDGGSAPATPVTGTILVTTVNNTSTTSFPDGTVSPGGQYNYALIPYGYNGTNAQTTNFRTSATIPAANATTLSLEPLAQPVTFTAATGGSNQINLVFSPASSITNAAGYVIVRRQDLANPTSTGVVDAAAVPASPTAGTTLVATISNTGTGSFSDLTVNPGLQYNYTIFPFGYNGSNALTYNYLLTAAKSANAFTLSNEPAGHAAVFNAAQAGTAQINLTFSAANSITNAAGYIILRRQDGNNPTEAGIVDGAVTPGTPTTGTTLITTITNTATTSFSDTGLPGQGYNYALIPYGYNGANALTYNYRTIITIPTASAFTLSLEPTGHAALFTATQAGTSQINLAFSAANTITNASGYIVLRRQDGSNPTAAGVVDGAAAPVTPIAGTTLVTVISSAVTTSFNDTGLSSGIQYNYALLPFGFNGTNQQTNNFRTAATIPTSNATTVVVEPSAQPTVIGFASITATGFTVNYAAAAGGAAGYIAFRKVSSSPATAIPVDGTTYVVGNILGDAQIAYIGSAVTFSESTLNASTAYFYDIFSFNGSGPTINYRTVSPLEGNQITSAAPPVTQASNLAFAAVQSTQLTLNWTSGSGAKRLVVGRSGSAVNSNPQNGTSYTASTAFGSGTQIGTGNFVVYDGTGTSVTVASLTANTTYHFQVFDYNGTGTDNSYNTSTAVANPASKLTLTAAPIADAASVIGQTGFTASWPAVTGATGGYFIDVSADDFASTVAPYNNFAVAGTSTPITGLTAGSTVKYRVRAANASGSSPDSNPVTVLLKPQDPVAIAGTQLTPPAVGFTAKWNAANGAASYVVSVATDAAFSSPVPGFGSAPVNGATSLAVSPLTAGTSYFYKVVAQNASGSSNASNSINQWTAPATPTNTNVPTGNITSSSFIAQWDAMPGATGYEVDVRDEDLVFVPGYDPKIVATPFASITGLADASVYVVQVRAFNSGGISASTPYVVVNTGGPPLVAPQISIAAPSASSAVKGVIAASTGKDNTITYYHRKITESAFTAGTPVPGDALEIAYDAEQDMDAIGMQYYFIAKDKYNRSDSAAAFVYRPFSNRDIKSEASLAVGGTLESYRIFSLPLKGVESIEEIFSPVIIHYGGYDKTKWRLVHYQSGRNVDFREGLTKIELGRGYWYNSVDAVSISVTGTAVEANQLNGGFLLNLDAGWTQIGNPFTFDVNWTDVLAKNGNPPGVGPLYVFDANNVSFKQTDLLPAWQGGFVKSSGAVSLFIPVTVKQSPGRIGSMGIETARLDEPAWVLPLRLTQGKYYNEMGAIGMHPDASNDNDRFDEQSLPRFVKYLEMNSYHWNHFMPKFARDVVTTVGSYNWEYTVESNFEGSEATLTWDAQSLGNNEAQLLLYDEAANIIVNMKRVSSYKFELSKERNLKFMFSSDPEKLLPGVTGFGRPYPNPFNALVTIPFLNDARYSTLEISVYDGMGKRVRTLWQGSVDPGYHEIYWDGTDDQGQPVAQGMYIYRMAGVGKSWQGRIIRR